MSVLMEIYCDVCGSKKGETNHWTYANAYVGDSQTLILHSVPENSEEEKHLCSDNCVTVIVQRWLSERKAQDDAAGTP